MLDFINYSYINITYNNMRTKSDIAARRDHNRYYLRGGINWKKYAALAALTVAGNSGLVDASAPTNTVGVMPLFRGSHNPSIFSSSTNENEWMAAEDINVERIEYESDLKEPTIATVPTPIDETNAYKELVDLQNKMEEAHDEVKAAEYEIENGRYTNAIRIIDDATQCTHASNTAAALEALEKAKDNMDKAGRINSGTERSVLNPNTVHDSLLNKQNFEAAQENYRDLYVLYLQAQADEESGLKVTAGSNGSTGPGGGTDTKVTNTPDGITTAISRGTVPTIEKDLVDDPELVVMDLPDDEIVEENTDDRDSGGKHVETTGSNNTPDVSGTEAKDITDKTKRNKLGTDPVMKNLASIFNALDVKKDRVDRRVLKELQKHYIKAQGTRKKRLEVAVKKVKQLFQTNPASSLEKIKKIRKKGLYRPNFLKVLYVMLNDTPAFIDRLMHYDHYDYSTNATNTPDGSGTVPTIEKELVDEPELVVPDKATNTPDGSGTVPKIGAIGAIGAIGTTLGVIANNKTAQKKAARARAKEMKAIKKIKAGQKIYNAWLKSKAARARAKEMKAIKKIKAWLKIKAARAKRTKALKMKKRCTICNSERGKGNRCRKSEKDDGCEYIGADDVEKRGVGKYGCYKCTNEHYDSDGADSDL